MSFPAYQGPRLRLNYTDESDLKVLYRIDMSAGWSLQVVGNPENASYEWLAEEGGGFRHSNCGYGDSDIALRDGLIVLHGLPASPITFIRVMKEQHPGCVCLNGADDMLVANQRLCEDCGAVAEGASGLCEDCKGDNL